MAPLACLPVFLGLGGRRAVLAAHTAAAAWKAELLSAAGAEVQVYAEKPTEDLLALAADPPAGRITIHRRAWEPQDFVHAAIAIGGFDSDGDAARFAHAARTAGVLVNVIDKPRYCDFAFGAIINRSPLVIGISTAGGAPVLAQAIRARLETLIPRGFARWADAARRWRLALQGCGLSFKARRRFWQHFTAHALTHAEKVPAQGDYQRLLAATQAEGAVPDQGSVTLVGTGPGDPELLTLRAVRAMLSADVVLYDDLVAPETLENARREARKMRIRSHNQAIETTLIALAKAGHRVVRLTRSDPMTCGSAGKEIAACRAAGVRVELVPGV